MSIKYGDDVEYANAKLSDSIVQHNGEPVYVDHVGGSGLASVRKLGGNLFYAVSLAELDLTPVSLGNINLSTGQTDYIARLPVRNWKQGLRLGNLYAVQNNRAVRTLSIDNPSLINCILGNYPSLNKCIELLMNEEVAAISFSRLFSLTSFSKKGVSSLLFKGRETGTAVMQDDRPVLSTFPKFNFLRELLEEAKT